ncbi:MAG: O-antigen ligase family protein [Cryomorphaceae bacterium]
MSFKEWRKWLGELPPVLRWFPLLVLLRPVIDNLYFLKEVSPLISPPYIVGVLTPVLCITALIQYRLPRFTLADKSFARWSALLLISALFTVFYDPLSLLSLEFVLKLAMPVYLFFFLRILIRSRRDLHGVLTTFLYSAVFVAAILLYELLINPISIEDSRGLQRIQGSFGDVVSYGMYIIFTTVITTYYFLSRQHVVPVRKLTQLLVIVAVINVLGLFNIHHTATYTIFILIFGLFLLFNMNTRNRSAGFAVVLVAGFLFSFFGSEIIAEKITPLVETDLAVYQGEKDSDQLLHGRMGRWRLMLANFMEEPVHVQFLGYPLSLSYVYSYIGIGSHNDFLRILFATGAIGLFFYLRFLYLIALRMSRLGKAQRFLLAAITVALLFFSISVTPTFYAPFMYFVLSIFAFILLPENQRDAWIDRP